MGPMGYREFFSMYQHVQKTWSFFEATIVDLIAVFSENRCNRPEYTPDQTTPVGYEYERCKML